MGPLQTRAVVPRTGGCNAASSAGDRSVSRGSTPGYDLVGAVGTDKPELLALLTEPDTQPQPTATEEDASFLELIEAADRFQREGKPGPWEAFTMSAEDLYSTIGNLSPELCEDFDLRSASTGGTDLQTTTAAVSPSSSSPTSTNSRSAFRDQVSWSSPGLRAVATSPAGQGAARSSSYIALEAVAALERSTPISGVTRRS